MVGGSTQNVFLIQIDASTSQNSRYPSSTLNMRDVICVKGALLRTSVTVNQLFSHVCDSIYGLHCTGSDTNVFEDAHER